MEFHINNLIEIIKVSNFNNFKSYLNHYKKIDLGYNNSILFRKSLERNKKKFYQFLYENNRDMIIFLDGENQQFYLSAFEYCLANNYESMLDFILKTNQPDLPSIKSGLTLACQKGHTKLVTKILKDKEYIVYGYDLLLEACENSYLDIAKLIMTKIKIEQQYFENLNKIFILTILKANLETIKWFYSKLDSYLIDYSDFFIFGELVIVDKLEILEFIYGIINPQDIEYLEIDYLLKIACESGQLTNLKWLINQFNPEIYSEYEELLLLIIKSGNLEMLQWFVEKKPNNLEINYDYCFAVSCGVNNFEMVKWFNDKLDINYGYENNLSFINSCGLSGNLVQTKWLYNIIGASEIAKIDLEHLIISICRKGDLEHLKWLIDVNKNNLDLNYTYLFRLGINVGHLEIAKWLYSLGKILKTDINDYSFRKVCYHGHLKIAKWLYDINKKVNLNVGFIVSCRNGHHKLVNWLLTLGYKNYQYGLGFKLACENGNYRIIQKLVFTHKQDIVYDSSCLIKLAYQGNLSIIKWLDTIKLKKDINYSDVFVSACLGGSLDTVKWLANNKLTGTLTYDQNIIFDTCCQEGYGPLLFWLISNNYIKVDETISSMGFIFACHHGRLDIAKYIYENYLDLDYLKILGSDFFLEVFDYGYLDVIDWLYNLLPNDLLDKNLTHQFIDVCVFRNYFDILKWLYNKVNFDFKYKGGDMYKYLCKKNKLDILKWIYDKNVKAIDFSQAFNISCRSNSFTIAKWLYYQQKNTIKPNINIELLNFTINNSNLDLFRWLVFVYPNLKQEDYYNLIINSVITNNLEIIKILYQRDVEKKFSEIIYNDKPLYYYICKKGYLDILKWLYYSLKLNLKINDEICFCLACEYGHIEMIEWIFFYTGKTNIHAHNDYAFRKACCNGHTYIAQWLYSLDKIDIHIEDDEAFKTSCLNGEYSIVKWLYSLDKKLVDNIDHELLFHLTILFHQTEYNYKRDMIKNLLKFLLEFNKDLVLLENENTLELLTNLDVKWYVIKEDWSGLDKIIKKECLNFEGDCCICYEKSEIKTNCQHFFCKKCLFKWYLHNNKCAYCKKNIDINKLIQ